MDIAIPYIGPINGERIIDYALNPVEARTTEEKHKKNFRPENLDNFLGIGAADIGHPLLKQIEPARIESRADTILNEAAVVDYRRVEGLSLCYR
ncbi:hypothetical protein HYU50_02945 [Candidatus Woesearchaeota archaeon]|nr:hypothetical protein [Candidatus Woesearchaeota archaeon]